MKYRAFRRIIVEIPAEPEEVRSAGGIFLPQDRQKSNLIQGKVVDGILRGPSTETRGPDVYPIMPGNIVLFNRAGALMKDRFAFLTEDQVLAVVEEGP